MPKRTARRHSNYRDPNHVVNLHAKLEQRAALVKPLRVGLIWAGKFGAMYLAQVPKIAGVHLAGIADLSPDNARANLARVGWTQERSGAASLDLHRLALPGAPRPRSTNRRRDAGAAYAARRL